MNVSFLIGNGFDLSCGIKSRYRDVYEEYIKTQSNSSLIERFKQDISYEIDNWGDFEVAMSKYMAQFNKEEDFLTCLRDFRRFLKKYLKREEKAFNKLRNNYELNNIVKAEMKRSTESFYQGFTHNLDNEIEQLIKKSDSSYIWYHYINFNYTFVFDNLIKLIDFSPSIIHIHGDLDEQLVLGMDNEDQLYAPFTITNKTRRGFIKSFFNTEYDSERLNNAMSYINRSDIICVYGMSLGESDERWRKSIFRWLLEDEKRHLFIYQYNLSSKLIDDIDERMDNEEDAKTELLSRLGLTEEEETKIFPRLHIPCGKNIFTVHDTIQNYQAEQEIEMKKKRENNDQL